MDVKVDLNPEDINKMVVEAILKSTLGDEVKKAVQRNVDQLSNTWQNPLDGVIKQHIERAISAVLSADFKDHLRQKVEAKMAGKITDELIDKIIDAAFRRLE
jgi:transcriptional accessory protein Tex/SPT6